MYGFKDAKEATINFEPGIVENVEIESIAKDFWKDSGVDKPVLKIVFKGAGGEKFTHTEFPLNVEKAAATASRFKMKLEDFIKKEVGKSNNRIFQILACFIDSKILRNIQATSWEAFIDEIVKISGNAYGGIKFRVKLVLNSKDYITLPSSFSPFIQTMDMPNTLKINPRFDRIIPKEQEDQDDLTIPEPPSEDVNFEDVPHETLPELGEDGLPF